MKEIFYRSTRDGDGAAVSAATAILQGISSDGGLYVPAHIPRLQTPLETLAQLDYRELALQIMQLYYPDFTEGELRQAVAGAYDCKFTAPDIAPLRKIAGVSFLELFHGPTLAFKDMALSVLPHLLKIAAGKTGLGQEVVILAATSGDTGKAALEGFAGVEGTRIIVFFPEYGVSQVQKRQMVTQAGDNTYVIGIEGNFDDAQSGVKQMFANGSLLAAMKDRGLVFSSANSINIGRLVPQIVYYVHAYLRAMDDGTVAEGSLLDVVVPTGNFGNILAAYYAKRMGLPLGKLICASNRNNVLYDFFTTGTYDRNREFHVTMSPSMDILISSNLERLLWHISGESATEVARMMQELATFGRYGLTDSMQKNLSDFAGGYASEEDTAAAIRRVQQSAGYLMDPHTAVAYAVWEKYREETDSTTPAVVVSTASPYKFPKDVMAAVDSRYADNDDFALFAEVERFSGVPVPQVVRELADRPVLHKRVCRKDELQQVVESILGL